MKPMYAKNCAKSPVRKMADGGSVGLFERLKAGNIDDPKSEAFRRWGTDSKSVESAPLKAPTPFPPMPDDSVGMSSPSSASISNDSNYRNDSNDSNYRNDSNDSNDSNYRNDSNEFRRRTADTSDAVDTPKSAARKKAVKRVAKMAATSAPKPVDTSVDSQQAKEGPRMTPPRQGFYGGDLENPLAKRAFNSIKKMFTPSLGDTNYVQPKGTVTPYVNRVNGGMIGNPTANQSVKKEAMTDPSFKENALGGGRASYGKK